ncbi:MAG: hypothetical protein LUD00_11040 [Prevotellaceae bacterium]|nr:hypothetical protein [Prevotellaceae bacterium]
MEIIIHGKPHAGSSKGTSDIDGLARNIVEIFFNGRDEFEDEQSLIVDARYWKNSWYSVYTYRRSNLKGFSSGIGRTTYFAISLVVPGGYCRRVSAVYELLRNVCNDTVVGTYISGNGKYMVQNLYDNAAFLYIAEKIRKGYINTEEVAFDSEFVPLVNFSNDKKSNVLWCDSEEFIRCLKTSGRIIVTEGESVKDPLLQELVHDSSQYDGATAEKGKRKEPEDNSKELLIGTNRSQRRKSSEEEPGNKTRSPLYEQRESMRQSSSERKSGIKWIRILPLVNTFLIVLTWIFLAGNHDNGKGGIDCTYESLKEDIKSLKDRVVALEKQSPVYSRDDIDANTSEDTNPDLGIWQNDAPIKVGDEVCMEKLLIQIKFKSGYAIHTANINNPKDIEEKVIQENTSWYVCIKPKNNQKPIKITYRSKESKTNPENKIVLEYNKTEEKWIRTE